MELIVISDTRLKIMLTQSDMSSYSLDSHTFDTDCESARRALCKILEYAQKSTGIEVRPGGVFVQIFESSDGGCEMFVTKYAELYDAQEVDMMRSATETETYKGALPKKRLVYRFKDLKRLLCGCRALSLRGYSKDSEAYRSVSGEDIYLFLYENEKREEMSVVLEFADPVFSPGIVPYISEHCIPICETDAVGVLSSLC